MVILEDIEFEKSIIDTCYHIAVPFQITVYGDGSQECMVYSFCKELAEEYERIWDDLLAEEALHWLAKRLFSVMEELGYDSSDMVMRSHREYRLLPQKKEMLPIPGTETELLKVLTDADRNDTEDLELDAFEMDGSNPEDAMTVVRKDGRIVCFAAVNDMIENDCTAGLDWIELNVECSPDYRCRGYASACVAELTRYYLDMGKGVKYLCDEENLPSIKTAEKVGYDLYSRVVPRVYYRRDEETEETEE